MVDVGTQHNEDRILEVRHVDLGAFVGSTDGDFGSIVGGVDDIERAGHCGSSLPVGAVAALHGTHSHHTFFACQREDVAFH